MSDFILVTLENVVLRVYRSGYKAAASCLIIIVSNFDILWNNLKESLKQLWTFESTEAVMDGIWSFPFNKYSLPSSPHSFWFNLRVWWEMEKVLEFKCLLKKKKVNISGCNSHLIWCAFETVTPVRSRVLQQWIHR